MPTIKMYLTIFTMLLICVRKGAHGWVLSVCSHQTGPIMWFSFSFAFFSLICYHHVIFKLNGKLEKEIYPLLWQVAIDGEIMCYFARFSGDLHDHRQGCSLALSIKSAVLNPGQPWNNKLLPALPCSVSVPRNKCLLSAKPLWAPNNFPWYGGNIYHPGAILHHFIKEKHGELRHELLIASETTPDRSWSTHKWTSKNQSKQSSSPSETSPT